MAPLVVLVVAGITGFVGYNEAAKIEKRFRKGPLGIPALTWGIGCFFFGLIGALVASALVIAALIGFAGYDEAAKYEQQYGEGRLGIPPLVWGVVWSCFGLIGTLTTSAFVVGALIGFVGYHEAARYEGQYGERPLGLSMLVWGVGCFFVGLVGALVTSTLAWAVVCVISGLVGALFLLIGEKNALLAERNALLAEKNAKWPVSTAKSSEAPADPIAATPPPPPQSTPPARQWGSLPPRAPAPQPRRWASTPPPTPTPPPGWSSPQPAASGRGGVGESDLLPRRR